MTDAAIQLLADEAVYRRTPAGQRELVEDTGRLSAPERRFLGVVTGFTPLRVLLDLGLTEGGVGAVILSLVDRKLVQLENPEVR